MKTFEKPDLIRKNINLKQTTNYNLIEYEYIKRQRKMCSDCKFFDGTSCLKKRVIRECVRYGLKNKE